MELRLPPEKRKLAREKDHLFYDELLRCTTHMTDEQKTKLESFINEL